MSVQNWFESLKTKRLRRPVQRPLKVNRCSTSRKLELETLEDRHMLAAVFSIGSAMVVEGNAGTKSAAVTVTVSEPHSNSVSVDYRTANGTAIAGSDYNAASGTLSFAKNETSKTILIPVIGDRIAESDEWFNVNLQNAKGGAKIAYGTGYVTITDDEPRIGISDVQANEGNSGTTGFNFTVTLSAASDVPVSVNYTTADGTAKAGIDYVPASGSVVFAAGETSKTVTIQVNGDRLPEADKTFSVSLNSPNNAGISRSIAFGTIVDKEPRVNISNVFQLEAQSGTTSFNFTISLSVAYDQSVTVNYTTADGTAKAGTDYVAASGSVVFAPGDTSKTVSIQVNGSSVPGADKTFYVNVSTPNNYAAIRNGVGIGNIIDRQPRITIGDSYYSYDGSMKFYFTVSLSAVYNESVTVDFTTQDETALAGVDYVAKSGTLTFAAGVTSQTIEIDVLDETYTEKAFTIQLSGASSNALLANNSAYGYWYYYYYDSGYISDYYGWY
jgi:hypothetical protein